MSDIYNIAITEFRSMDMDALKDVRCHSEAAFSGIMAGMTAMGNLAYWASVSEEYSPEQALGDLRGIGEMMSQLPKIAEALSETAQNAQFEIYRREGFPQC